MVRQRIRNKTIEELYSNQEKFGSNTYHTQVPKNGTSTIKALRCSDRDLMAFGISSSSRRKGRKISEKKDEKTFLNEEKLFGENGELINKKESSAKNKTSKEEKTFGPLNNMTPGCDNKNLVSFMEQQKNDPEKDEDTEEFFELIRETVENAVGKTLSELLNRNFREISSKIENLCEQIRTTDEKLNKLQSELNNKIVHYGEENSRHFRYLCMKSEYDKMFYQHQSMITTMPTESRPNMAQPFSMNFGSVAVTPQSQTTNRDIGNHPCPSCRPSASRATSCDQPSKNINAERNISTKSSDMGMKEVIAQIQKFCTQLQQNDCPTSMVKKQSIPRLSIRGHGVSLNDDDDEEDNEDDDDDLLISSDETPRSMCSVDANRKAKQSLRESTEGEGSYGDAVCK